MIASMLFTIQAMVEAMTVVFLHLCPVAEKRRTRSPFATALKANPVAESAMLPAGSGTGTPLRVYHRWVRAGMS